MSNKEEIKGRKQVRLFAPFRTKKEQNERLHELLDAMTDKYKFDLVLFIGQLESTQVEGFSDENN